MILISFRANEHPITCNCSGVIKDSRGNSAFLNFDLMFNDKITEEEILRILRLKTLKEENNGFEVTKIRDFIIDINHIVSPPVLPTVGPHIDIIGNA